MKSKKSLKGIKVKSLNRPAGYEIGLLILIIMIIFSLVAMNVYGD